MNSGPTNATAMLALRLPPEIEDGLGALARRTGRSKDDHACGAILRHLENLENLAAVEQRLAAVQGGESDPVPVKDLLSRYGAAD